MTRLTRQLLSLLLVILGVIFFEKMRPVGQPPGILAPDPPSVQMVVDKPPLFERDNYVIEGLAQFKAKARVLSLERYGGDPHARIAPLDVALGWDKLSDSTTFKVVDVAQTERQIVFESYDPALPNELVATMVVNLHVIGADGEVDSQLRNLRRGNIVQIEGWLVEVRAQEGWRWKGEARSASPPMPGNVLWVRNVEVVQ
jgi:hypothetical protein